MNNEKKNKNTLVQQPNNFFDFESKEVFLLFKSL